MKPARRRRGARLVVTCALAAAVATALFVSACGDDTEGTTSRPRDSGADVLPKLPDTGAPVPRDSAALDANPANAEASMPEAWDRTKSARDAALEASARYCNPNDQGVGQFCWDFTFDDGITAWNEVLRDGGDHALVGGNAGDPLRALQSTVSSDGGPPRWVALRYLINIDDIPDAAAGITLSFTFRAGKVNSSAIIGGLQIGTPTGPVLRGLAVYPNGCTLVQGIPCLGENTYEGTDRGRRRPFDPNQWYRARIHLQPSGVGTGTVAWSSTMTVGDTVVAEHDTLALPATNAFPTSVNLFVGAFDTDFTGQTQVEIDDVFLE